MKTYLLYPVDGADIIELPNAEIQYMVSQKMRSVAGFAPAGEYPALLGVKLSTLGECTINRLLILEAGRLINTVVRAVKDATVVASQIGKGV
jgi:pyrroline-5-carboxylate reductase